MTTKLGKLRDLLRELFQLDQADLDFGIYRIMNQKRDEVERFLDEDLLPQVRAAFEKYRPADKAALQAELDKTLADLAKYGVDPETNEAVLSLRKRLAQGVDVAALEDEVFSDLFTFFRRYYNGGDFLSLRRYKEGVYAIPYEGEEVKLHWANHDQYYIKSSEYLTNYAFKLGQRKVRFELAAANTERDNNKAQNGNERRFILAEEDAVAEESGELVARFEYRPDGDKRTQAELNAEAAASIVDAAPAPWKDTLGRKVPTKANPGRTVLDQHMHDYTARNTFDYFIHKDLGGFLRRELDFFIKNEVLLLDDVDQIEDFAKVEEKLSKIKVLRAIAHKVIAFLAQLEDFQKKLWLKKKFVVETNWCITLDRVPEEFYPEIAANDAQREEWVRCLAIDKIEGDLTTPPYSAPLTEKFLAAHPFLTLDTRHFDTEFREKLLASLHELASSTRGVLVNAQNFDALGLLECEFGQSVDSVYLDPPYNTDAAPINYKNEFRHSTWLCLFEGPLRRSIRLLNENAVVCVTIDDFEAAPLRLLLDTTFDPTRRLGIVPIKNNPAGRTGTVGFSTCHEYALFYGCSETARPNRLPHSDAQKKRYAEKDDQGAFEWTNFRKHGGSNTYRTTRPRQFFPLYVEGSEVRVPEMTWNNDSRSWEVTEKPRATEEVLWPIDSKGRERIWDFNAGTTRKNLKDLLVRPDSQGQTAVYRKWRLNDKGLLPQTWWDKSEYSAAAYGTNLLSHMFGETHSFMFPKSLHAVADCIFVGGLKELTTGTVLDFFAGSGTTAHAVIHLNRQDEGERKFILVEMGDYFDEVTLSRIKKAAYSADWKDAEPKSHNDGTSQIFKYLRLESYEDALDNLELRERTEPQQQLLSASPEAREDYMLSYMLDVETQGSASLLNVEQFRDPFNYKLKITRNAEARVATVDLVETFNYLIGLRVDHMEARVHRTAEFERDEHGRLQVKGGTKPCDAGDGWTFRVIQGRDPSDERVLVIWRVLTDDPEKDNLMLDTFCTKMGFSTRDMEFDLIYVNGDNNLENLRRDQDTWKVQLIEESFHRLMFDVQDV